MIFGTPGLIWADGFDGNLCYWILEWGYHALIKSNAPFDFWHANTFHPMRYSLAVSESFLSAQIFYSPLRALGYEPLAAIYLTLGISFVAGAVLTDIFAKQLGFQSLTERILIVVCCHCLMSNTTMLYHYQLFGFQFAPAFLFALLVFLNSPNIRTTFNVAIVYVIASCYSTYMAPMLLASSLPIVFTVIWQKVRVNGTRSVFGALATKGNLLVSGSLAVFLYLVQLRPYLLMKKNFPKSSLSESMLYSANWYSIFSGKSRHSFWYDNVNYAAGDWERTSFLGYAPLLALVAAIIFLIARKKPLGEKKLWAWTFIWIWTLSTGPFLSSHPSISLPFKWTTEIVPGLDSVRAPGRFGMLLGVPLGIFLVLCVRHILQNKFRSAVIWFLSLLIAAEALPNFGAEKFRRVNWPTYMDLATKIRPNSTLLEIPLAVGDNYSVLMNAMDQMKGSTLHWARIVAGYGAKTSPSFDYAVDLDRKAQTNPELALVFFEFMRSNNFRYLLIHPEQVSPSYMAAWRSALKECASCQVIVDHGYLLVDTIAQN